MRVKCEEREMPLCCVEKAEEVLQATPLGLETREDEEE